MLKKLTIAGITTFVLSTAAYAGQCPNDMKKIDAALETAQLSEVDRASVLELRATGEALHSSGSHSGSVAALAQAKTLLGL